MGEPQPSVITGALVAAVRAALPELGNRVTADPPEHKPPALSVWFDYGPAAVEMGLLDVTTHAVQAVVAIPRKGAYPSEHRIVTDAATVVREAIRATPLYALEAILTGLIQNRATGSGWAGEPDVLVAATIDLTLETKTQIQDNP